VFTSLFLKILNMEASSSKSRPREILEKLQIREGVVVADLGSGGGYFTLEFARLVGRSGKVYAVDRNAKYLDFIKREAQRHGLTNVSFILAANDHVHLPKAGIDLIFVRNVVHHLPEPARYFANLKECLKQQGRLAVIEHKEKHGFNFVSLFKHFTPVNTLYADMEHAGYSWLQSFDFLPEQTFNLFGLK